MRPLDENGYLFFEGSFKEMIKSNGYSVFQEEVEKYLQHRPAVQQAVAVGYQDDRRGEHVRAFIVLRPEYKGFTSEEKLLLEQRRIWLPISIQGRYDSLTRHPRPRPAE